MRRKLSLGIALIVIQAGISSALAGSQLTASISSTTDVSCSGFTNGSVTASVSGGIPNYSYAWSNGASTFNTAALTSTISGLAAGTYTVTVTDDLGATETATGLVMEPPALSVTTSVNANVLCNGGNDGIATVMATGGVPGYDYSWSNGATTQSISSLAAGTYSVTVTDQNGCDASSSTTVTQPTALMSTASTVQNVSCNGGGNGEVIANGSGGTMPYSYAWNTSETAQTETNVAAGTYTVTVTDDNGCFDVASTSVTEPSALVPSTAVLRNESCQGSSNDGILTSQPTGGTPPYSSYLWSNGATTASLLGLASGTYTVTVSDSNGCSASEPIALPADYTGLAPFNGAMLVQEQFGGGTTAVENTCVDLALIADYSDAGTIAFASFENQPSNASGIVGAVSEYRWTLGSAFGFAGTGGLPTSLGLCFDLDDIPMPGVADPSMAVVELYHRPTVGTGMFTTQGPLTYDAGTNAFCDSDVPLTGEFALGSATEPLPVSLRTFYVD